MTYDWFPKYGEEFQAILWLVPGVALLIWGVILIIGVPISTIKDIISLWKDTRKGKQAKDNKQNDNNTR